MEPEATVATAYDAEAWHDLFVAVAGAAAALTGLLFVAVSINLADVLKGKGLTLRAGETLGELVALAVLSILVLVPGQSTGVLGAELIVLAVVGAALELGRRSREGFNRDLPVVVRIVPTVLVLAPALFAAVAGITLLAGAGGGLYWTVPAVIIAFAGSVSNAWVLLVEILR